MEENNKGNQEINCTVETCRFNNQEENKCILKAIEVAPIDGCDTMECDESMCASYEYFEDEE